MQHHLTEFVILSAELSKLPPEINKRRTETLISILDDLKVNYKQVKGVYKGHHENSFMVVLNHDKGIIKEFIKEIAINNFNQESILYRDKYDTVFLEFSDITVKLKGRFTPISKEDTVLNDNYTYFPQVDQYYTVK